MELLGGVCFNRALVSLELSFCGLTAEAGPLLVDGLMKCPTLKTLELKGNDLGASTGSLYYRTTRDAGVADIATPGESPHTSSSTSGSAGRGLEMLRAAPLVSQAMSTYVACSYKLAM